MDATATRSPEREEFYRRLSGRGMAPLWEVLSALVTREPTTECRPALWRYDEVRPFLMEAGRMITAREAERRVLILENPGFPRGASAITPTLYAGIQLILPGEVAPAHRHAQSALRFVLEPGGAYTAVDGERATMRYGDFIITPSWAWHDHGSAAGDEPTVWLDGLDIPLVRLLGASFAEPGGADVQAVSRPEGDALARFGSGLLPVDWRPGGLNSPVFRYPWDRTREALDALARAGDWDPFHGLRMRYVNPADGGSAMPTIFPFVQMLPKGFETRPYRSTDATVLVGVEGRGETRIGAETFAWGPRDVMVVPSWAPVSHRAFEDAVLFGFSDRVVQERLGLWRESRAE